MLHQTSMVFYLGVLVYGAFVPCGVCVGRKKAVLEIVRETLPGCFESLESVWAEASTS